MAPLTFSPFIGPAGMLGFFTFDITRKGGFFGWKRSILVKSRLRLGRIKRIRTVCFVLLLENELAGGHENGVWGKV